MSEITQTRIGRYEIRERIGAGGTARVYKAWDSNLERMVALKILYEHLAEDTTFKERFEREAKLIAGFNHPNIVQVYDFNTYVRDDIPFYYMVMSYIPGRTLREELEELQKQGKSLPFDRILQIMINLTDALGYAHQRDMVHRDVKPGNIIFREDGQAVLTDFGIARMTRSERMTQQGMTSGTPLYMSPEQANGEPGDARSDLYSLAIILFEMLVGQPPFREDNNLSVMLKHMATPIPRLDSFKDLNAPKLELFVQRALAKNPNARFESADVFAKALKLALDSATPLKTYDDATQLLLSSQRIPVAQLPPNNGNAAVQTSIALEVPKRSTNTLWLAIGLSALIIGIIAIGIFNLVNDPAPVSTSDIDDLPSITGEIYFNSDFDPDEPTNIFWSQEETGLFSTRITPEGFYSLENQAANTADTSIFQAKTLYNNVSISMDAKLLEGSQRASAYGIVFRYQDDDNYNVFAADGVGRYSIWRREDAIWTELRGIADEAWTMDDAVNPIGETNRLSITILDDNFTAYVNNKVVVRLSDATFLNGRIGLYIATGDGSAIVTIDKFRIFSSSSVPSMTGSSG